MASVVVSCEHASHAVPRRWRHVLDPESKLLKSHRGYDPGALPLARALARRLGAPLVSGRVTRLLVDLNRPRSHPGLWSDFTRRIAERDQAYLVSEFYAPYWADVVDTVESSLRRGRTVVHLSVHSFTPRLAGTTRTADLGLLYDPSRSRELSLCIAWQRSLKEHAPGLRVRRNYPYRGVDAGLTSSLRKHFASPRYLGIEVEVNQKLVRSPRWPSALEPKLTRGFAEALRALWRER